MLAQEWVEVERLSATLPGNLLLRTLSREDFDHLEDNDEDNDDDEEEGCYDDIF